MIHEKNSPYFLIFIVISALAFTMIPAVTKSFNKASDTYVIENMKRTQADMYLYEFDNYNYVYACIGGSFVILESKILQESGDGLSCTLSKDKKSLSLYTRLKSGEIYCVDSNGYSGFVGEEIKANGRCSKE